MSRWDNTLGKYIDDLPIERCEECGEELDYENPIKDDTYMCENCAWNLKR